MPIVTLTTDWGNGDFYLGCLKGRVLSRCPDVTFADITHHIQAFNTLQAAFVLRNVYYSFPKGSIHVVGVNSEPSAANPIVAISANQHFFIGPNDGMFSLVLDDTPDEVVLLNATAGPAGFKSPELVGQVVEAICNGSPLSLVGEACDMKREMQGKPTYDDSLISGLVVYIDAFGNAITNITRELFERMQRGRKFEIIVQNSFTKIDKISDGYDDVKQGRLVAIFNSLNLLEVAINRGNIAQLESLDSKSSIRVKFG